MNVLISFHEDTKSIWQSSRINLLLHSSDFPCCIILYCMQCCHLMFFRKLISYSKSSYYYTNPSKEYRKLNKTNMSRLEKIISRNYLEVFIGQTGRSEKILLCFTSNSNVTCILQLTFLLLLVEEGGVFFKRTYALGNCKVNNDQNLYSNCEMFAQEMVCNVWMKTMLGRRNFYARTFFFHLRFICFYL